jgi:hypothetical protein
MYEDEEGRAMPMNRRMRRMQERDAKKDTQGGGRKAARRGRASPSASGSATPQPQPQGSGPTGSKKRVVAENGKVLVVDSLGDVYLEQEDEDGKVAEFLLDVSCPGPYKIRRNPKLTPLQPNELTQPTFKDTAVVRLPLWAYQVTLGRFISKRADDAEYDDDEITEGEALDIDDADSEPGKPTPSSGSAEDFELLEKSVDELGQAKTSGSQKQASKAGKRKNKKR